MYYWYMNEGSCWVHYSLFQILGNNTQNMKRRIFGKISKPCRIFFPCIYFPLLECLAPPRRAGQISILQDVHQSGYDAVYMLLTMYVTLDINIVFFNPSCKKHRLSIRQLAHCEVREKRLFAAYL